MPAAADWNPDMACAPRTRQLRLLDRQTRFGRWNDDAYCWVSTIDPRVRLNPVAWKEMPKHDGLAD